jgi:hypothetical protein
MMLDLQLMLNSATMEAYNVTVAFSPQERAHIRDGKLKGGGTLSNQDCLFPSNQPIEMLRSINLNTVM